MYAIQQKASAATIRSGMAVNYLIDVDGKEILTGGWVTKAVKTGEDMITVTVQHWKTGEEFTNVLHADQGIRIHLTAMANKGLSGSMTMLPTKAARVAWAYRAVDFRDVFFRLPVGTELTLEASIKPGKKYV